IGVHQDGLVHVSAMANRFVKDPHEIVKPGQIVKVKVMDIDVKRQRISLTMRLDDAPGAAPRPGATPAPEPKRAPAPELKPSGAIALALERARLKK
ncbi:MAG: S1 RNA-binding domain-containing protein, partial [Candidatus Binatia bacterium]